MDRQRTADGLPLQPGRIRRSNVLAAVGSLEVLSLAALLINLATVHDAAVAQVIGPVHGTLYLLGIAAAFASTRLGSARALSVLPVVGAFLAWRNVRRAEDDSGTM